jgi:hypothetical protein
MVDPGIVRKFLAAPDDTQTPLALAAEEIE